MTTAPTDDVQQDMTPWVAIKVTLKGHRKVLRLQRLLGLDSELTAMGIVTSLLIETFLNEWSTGDWSKWEPEDVEYKIGWRGDNGVLIEALQKSGFLDGMVVHDWARTQRRQIRDRMRHRPMIGGRPAPVDDSEKMRERSKAVLAAKKVGA